MSAVFIESRAEMKGGGLVVTTEDDFPTCHRRPPHLTQIRFLLEERTVTRQTVGYFFEIKKFRRSELGKLL